MCTVLDGYSYSLKKIAYVENCQTPRQSKTGQDEAKQDKTRRYPEKLSPDFKKYTEKYTVNRAISPRICS